MLKNVLSNQKGNSLVEATFILPVFIILLFGITQFGLAIIAKQTITHAAYEASRIGALTNNENKMKQKVFEVTKPIDKENKRTSIKIEPFSHKRGEDIELKIDYSFPLFIPFFNQREIKLQSHAISRSECSKEECHLFD